MELRWTGTNGWIYSLEPEGHLWRFRGHYQDGEAKTIDSDFGLIPGGAFVAIESLVLAQNGISAAPEEAPVAQAVRLGAQPKQE